MTTYIPKTPIMILGSALSGSDGDSNRTYALEVGSVSAGMVVIVNNVAIQLGTDYLFNTPTITFLNSIYNTDIITINYSISSGLSSASGNSYTTPELVGVEIRASATFSSSTIPTLDTVTTWIEEASREIEVRTGNLFSSTLNSSTYVDYDGDCIFRLPQSPVIAINELRYNNSPLGETSSWITLEEGYDKDFITYLDEAEVEFIVPYNQGKKKICITYSSGFTTVPLDIQRLCTLLVAKRVIMSLSNSQSNTEGGDIQVGTIRVSDPSTYSVTYLKSMNQEINDLYDKCGYSFKTSRLTRVY